MENNQTEIQETATETATETQVTVFEETFSLDIKKDNVGMFIGPNGKNLKRYVIFESKQKIVSEFDHIEKIEDIKSMFCMVDTNDDNDDVVVHLKCSDPRFLEIMKDCIRKHQSSILEKSKHNSNISKYVFKTMMDHQLIAKYIGKGGYNIQQIRDVIEERDPESSNIRISINEDKKIRMMRLKFDVIKTEFTSDQEVLITITMVTKNRENTFDILKEVITDSINRAHDTNHHKNNHHKNNHHKNNEEEEEDEDTDGWGKLSKEDQEKFDTGW